MEVGDKVRRKGDYEMTIKSIRDQRALCEWTDRNGALHEGQLGLSELRKVEPDGQAKEEAAQEASAPQVRPPVDAQGLPDR